MTAAHKLPPDELALRSLMIYYQTDADDLADRL